MNTIYYLCCRATEKLKCCLVFIDSDRSLQYPFHIFGICILNIFHRIKVYELVQEQSADQTHASRGSLSEDWGDTLTHKTFEFI